MYDAFRHNNGSDDNVRTVRTCESLPLGAVYGTCSLSPTQPVGFWSAWRMRNKLRKICTHHRLEDRLRGTTRTNHRGYHTPIRTTEQSLADSPRSRLSGSREGESLPGGAQRSPPTTSITSQITTVETVIYAHERLRSFLTNSLFSSSVLANSSIHSGKRTR